MDKVYVVTRTAYAPKGDVLSSKVVGVYMAARIAASVAAKVEVDGLLSSLAGVKVVADVESVDIDMTL